MTVLSAAVIFGLVGLKPGPLGIFVIQETLSKGIRHGLIASLAPLITEGFIIVLALLLTAQLRDSRLLIAFISIAGAMSFLHIAYRIYTQPANIQDRTVNKEYGSLISAVKINCLNPSPYIFWFTIGMGYILKGSTLEAWLFIF